MNQSHLRIILHEELLCPESAAHLIAQQQVRKWTMEEIDSWIHQQFKLFSNCETISSATITQAIPMLPKSEPTSKIPQTTTVTTSQSSMCQITIEEEVKSRIRKRKSCFSSEEIDLLQSKLKKPRLKYKQKIVPYHCPWFTPLN